LEKDMVVRFLYFKGEKNGFIVPTELKECYLHLSGLLIKDNSRVDFFIKGMSNLYESFKNFKQFLL